MVYRLLYRYRRPDLLSPSEAWESQTRLFFYWVGAIMRATPTSAGATTALTSRANHQTAIQTDTAPAMWIPTKKAGTPEKYWVYPTAACATNTASKISTRFWSARSEGVLRIVHAIYRVM